MFDKERQEKLENYLRKGDTDKLNAGSISKFKDLVNTSNKSALPIKSKCLEVITYPDAKWMLESGKVKKVTFETKTLIDFGSGVSVQYSDLNKVIDIDPLTNHNVNLLLTIGNSSVTIPFNKLDAAMTTYEYIKRILVGKGNNYVSIKDGEISGKTIPSSKKGNKQNSL